MVEGLSRLLGQLEPDWPAGFLLPDGRAVQCVPVRGDVIDPYRYNITATKFASLDATAAHQPSNAAYPLRNPLVA